METDKTTVIKNGLILTMDSSFTIHKEGMILIEGSRISYVGPFRESLLAGKEPYETIDASNQIVLPGFINTHTHIGMSLFRGLADDTQNRLREIIFPLEKQFVTEDLVYWASLHTLSEMIRGGTTAFADMYYFADKSAEAASRAGVRAIAGESVMSAPAPDAAVPEESYALVRHMITRWRDNPLITPAVAPHAPYSLTRRDAEDTAALSAETGIPILSHLAEMPFEEAATLEKFSLRPVPFYDETGLLNERSVMAHCIFADREDRRILKERNSGIAHNPDANGKSGKGIAPAYEFYTEGARIGIGTDGPMSGNRMDTVGLLGNVSKFQKIRHSDPTVMKPRDVLAMATIGGARALHLESETGSLEEGKAADITMISTDSPAMFPLYDPYAALVYAAEASDVSSVMINGKLVMKERRLLTLDREEIRSGTAWYIEKIRREFRDYSL